MKSLRNNGSQKRGYKKNNFFFLPEKAGVKWPVIYFFMSGNFHIYFHNESHLYSFKIGAASVGGCGQVQNLNYLNTLIVT